jgi:dihydropteroate synthase
MKRYLRPLGILQCADALRAIDQGHALPLAGGPLAFSLVEIIERSWTQIERRIVLPSMLAGKLHAHTVQRGSFSGMSLKTPIVMGIVNATPDSFFDGGAFLDPGAAIAHAMTQIESGAGIIDIGGESTRPGAIAVEPAEEIRRVIPVIAGIRSRTDAVVSIDTRNAATMRAAIDAGATIVNDVSALSHDPASLALIAQSEASIILMHMRGSPADMQQSPAYGDVALDIYDYLEARIIACLAAGIDRSRIAIDPGIGFGKTPQHNLALLQQLTLFHGLGVPLLIGVSRKGFIASLSAGEPAEGRLPGSLAAGLASIGQGVQILRVHDVAETIQALKITTML